MFISGIKNQFANFQFIFSHSQTSLQQLVYEKEKRLCMMMKMHGLGDGVYWLVAYSWQVLHTVLLHCLDLLSFLLG